MNYPLKILPSKIYKMIDCDLSEHIIARYTEVGKEDLLDEISFQIKEEYICTPREHMRDLSTALIGVFEFKHFSIELTNIGKIEYGNYCDPDIEVETPIENTHYKINERRHYWWVQVKEINLKEINYSMSNREHYATCYIIHTPMKWNYWHFSIRWKTHLGFWDSIEDKKIKKNIGKNLGHEARTFVKMFAKVTVEPDYYELNKEFYCLRIE